MTPTEMGTDQALVLSYRKERKGYTVFVHNDAGKSILRQRWFAGKRKRFPEGKPDALPGNRKNGYAFEGDSFHAKHAGGYTVHITFDDETAASAFIKIKKNHVVVVVVPLILALAIGGTIWALNNRRPVPPKKPNGSAVSRLNDNGSADNGALGTNKGRTASMITDHVASAIIAPSGNTGSNASWYVENISSNSVIMQAIVMKDGQQIAQTTPIRPGEHITKVQLSSTVPAGTYTVQAVLKYYTNDSAATYISEAVYKIKLQVK